MQNGKLVAYGSYRIGNGLKKIPVYVTYVYLDLDGLTSSLFTLRLG